MLLEPNIHLPGWPNQLLKQFQEFGINFSEQEWKSAEASGQSFAAYFESRIRPALEKLDYWGVKMVNFAGWEKFLDQYPTENLLLCVRDLRDVILSAFDLAPKLNNFVDAAWIEKRAIETADALVAMADRPHTLLRYEDFCRNPSQIDRVALSCGLPQPTDHRMSLEAVPHRKYENEKHAGGVSTRSVSRHQEAADGPEKELAQRVWERCSEYNSRFGYSAVATTVAQTSQPNETGQSAALTEFWKQDQLANIIPSNNNLGEFPEGWDVRPYLWELLRGHIQKQVLEVGCGYGRLCQGFPAEKYLGVDINSEAVTTATQRNPGYQFRTIGFQDAYPTADAIYLYTVLLHIDDESIRDALQRLTAATNVVLIAEILGKERWRRGGNPPVFNRDLKDYVALMAPLGFHLETLAQKPYQHYPDTEISFLKFVRTGS